MQITPSTLSSLNNQNSFPKQGKNESQKNITLPNGTLLGLNGQEVSVEKLEKVKAALQSFNEILKPTHLEFKIHDEAGRYYVKIVDDKTQEVIKQIPSEEFLKMISETRDQLGLLVDKRV